MKNFGKKIGMKTFWSVFGWVRRKENKWWDLSVFSLNLGCTDTAPRPAHSRPSRRDAATREGRRRPRVLAASCHVAILESGRRGWNRHRRGRNWLRRDRNWPTRSVSAVSACIGRNGPVRPKFKKKKKRCITHRLT